MSGRKGDVIVTEDEQPGKADASKIPNLKPAFNKDGSVTAANAASISDGAAALVMTLQSTATEKGLTPIARVVAQAALAQKPALFTTAPVGAIQKVLDKAGWAIDDVDLFEVNEAFAAVVLRFLDDTGAPHDKVNVNGGAIALGHPIGATGPTLLATILDELERRALSTGLISMCTGGGMATATIIERI